MAFEDWGVEVFDVTRQAILDPDGKAKKNDYTGLPIDPDGLTQSLVTMRLTHRASGKFLDRADVFSFPTAETLTKYARDVIAVADANIAVQKTDQAPSPLKGPLDVRPPQVEPSEDQKNASVFQQADQIKKRLSEIGPEEVEAIARAQAVIDAKQKPVKDAEIARLKEQLATVEAAAASLAVSDDGALVP